MCGLLGWFSENGIQVGYFEKILGMLRHRGPEGSGLWQTPDHRLFLGHTRLKIIDLSENAAQPMISPDGRWILVFNGEIMNYRELRSEVGDSWFWHSHGDTELLLALWALHGQSCLDKLVGMFAFCIYDSLLKEIFLVRDRFGIKPLYWSDLPGGGFAFASEIPPLLRLLPKVLPNESTVRTYLEAGLYDHGEHTFFQGISSLTPGSILRFQLKDKKKNFQSWYLFAEQIPDLGRVDSQQIKEEVERLVRQAVFSHLVADVRVGLNISGGVDSAMLIKMTQEKIAQPHLFTQDYDGYSELPWIQEIANKETMHVLTLNSKDVMEQIEKTVAYQAEPFGGIFVCGYNFLYQAAGVNGVTVILDGNGVDEAFLGYRRYHQIYVAEAPDLKSKEQRSQDFAAFWGELPSPPHLHAAIDGTFGLQTEVITSKLKQNPLLQITRKMGFGDPVREAAALDLLAAKIPRGLRFNDRVSMAHSIELRVPFLDHRLVEFAFAIPVQLLINRNGTKEIFRKILSRKVPASVAYARKRSIQSPQREWLAHDWKKKTESLLLSKSFNGRGWLDSKKCLQKYREYVCGKKENSFFIWQWINLELWAKKYLD